MSESTIITHDDFRPLRLADLRQGTPEETDWLWEGYIARGNVTLLTSFWKTGKTTLLSLLLDRMRTGGEVAGAAVKPGKAVVVSEEARSIWLRRGRRFNLEEHVWLICRPFVTRPR